MTDLINKLAGEIFGIKADPCDAERLCAHIKKKYGSENPQDIRNFFTSGEAACFLTVNETYFFREPLHFTFLRNMLPNFEDTEMRICSAATSTGCEAYSIAMFLEAYNRGRAKPLRYHIDAFDINPEAVKKASLGIYNERSMRDDGSSLRYMAEPWVKRLERGWQVDPSLKKNINFFAHNLMDDIAPNAYHFVFFNPLRQRTNIVHI